MHQKFWHSVAPYQKKKKDSSWPKAILRSFMSQMPKFCNNALFRGLFSSKFFGKMSTVAISFVFDKYCPIMD